MNPIIKEITFLEILPIWKHELWPKRQSIIEPVSAINIDSEIDTQILTYSSLFLAVVIENKIVSVSSGHPTSNIDYRLRGMWTAESFQRMGFAAQLVLNLIEDAKIKGYKTVWVLSRLINEKFYEKIGFIKKKSVDKYEYGPHYIMIKNL